MSSIGVTGKSTPSGGLGRRERERAGGVNVAVAAGGTWDVIPRSGGRPG